MAPARPRNALGADPNVKLTAMADTFADQIETSLEQLRPNLADKIAVPDDHKFVGFDAYQKLLATDVDVVLLATPPHFRPMHLKAAVAAGKHVFCEKPVAVDAPGVHSVLATVAEAKRKNLALVSGLCYRYDLPKRELIQRVRDGAIGDIRTIHTSYNTGTLWHQGREPEWSDMEFQMRNWLYFTWLSGDFNVEQHVHSLDKAAWVLGDQHPVQAYGLGGRQVRTGEEYGNVFDHMAVVYEFADGVRRVCQLPADGRLLGRRERLPVRHQGDGRDAEGGDRRRESLDLSRRPSRTCTTSSTRSCSPASARAIRSTTATTWPTAR